MMSVINIDRKIITIKFLGKPYTDDFKCFDLIRNIYNELGITIKDFDSYISNDDFGGQCLTKPLDEYFTRVEVPSFLDIVLIKGDKGYINHAGVMLDNESFIHTCRAGTIISFINQSRWKEKIEGFYRFKYGNDNICSK